MDIRYAAGLLDGEGCIRISKQQFKNHVRYQLFVTINMADPRPLVELQKEFGGCFSWGAPRKDPRHRPLHGWAVSSRNALLCLERVRPWLIVKAAEADLAIEFQKGVEYGKNSPQEVARRERIKHQMTVLKFRTFDPADFGMVANSGDIQNGQSRAKQPRVIAVGVCNESMPPATAKRDSDLHGNMQSEAEMTSPFPIIEADWMPPGQWALINPADLKRMIWKK